MSLPTRLENPVERDPHDFGSREFWKAANAHAVRRWAEMADENVQLKGLLAWAETILCNARPEEEISAEEWRTALRNWRNAVHVPQCRP